MLILFSSLSLGKDKGKHDIQVEDADREGVQSDVTITRRKNDGDKEEVELTTRDDGSLSGEKCIPRTKIKVDPHPRRYKDEEASCEGEKGTTIVVASKEALGNLKIRANRYFNDKEYGKAALTYNEFAVKVGDRDEENALRARQNVLIMFLKAVSGSKYGVHDQVEEAVIFDPKQKRLVLTKYGEYIVEKYKADNDLSGKIGVIGKNVLKKISGKLNSHTLWSESERKDLEESSSDRSCFQSPCVLDLAEEYKSGDLFSNTVNEGRSVLVRRANKLYEDKEFGPAAFEYNEILARLERGGETSKKILRQNVLILFFLALEKMGREGNLKDFIVYDPSQSEYVLSVNGKRTVKAFQSEFGMKNTSGILDGSTLALLKGGEEVGYDKMLTISPSESRNCTNPACINDLAKERM
ncbi:hypothetical protein ACJJIW_15630 [Microbulbifer sp. JMSA004]|uniref:hypothetical protein n=1 Tax=Microbulbifer sp. JMSA004 TaxID=3243370 RepID=UPI004039C349